jgi:prophage regulatory protein
MSEKRLIDLAEVTRLTGLKRTAIYERMAHKTFPASVKLGTASRWLLSEIEQWIDDQVAARDHRQLKPSP